MAGGPQKDARCALFAQRPRPAREAADAGEAPLPAAPDVCLSSELGGVGLVDDQPARLAAPVRARLAETGRGRDRNAVLALAPGLELVTLRDRTLMRMAGQDQL